MGGKITAGRVGGLFGTKGELTLTLFDPFPRDPNPQEPLFVEIDGHAVPLFLERFVRRGVRGATAVFADIDTAERATELIGREFSIRVGKTADEEDGDELYFENLVGWSVEAGRGRTGSITAFFDSEFNPLLEITLDGSTVLVPAREEFIAELDEQRRSAVFDLPEGLLDLNK